jgi:hypothetical protein
MRFEGEERRWRDEGCDDAGGFANGDRSNGGAGATVAIADRYDVRATIRARRALRRSGRNGVGARRAYR